MWYIVPILDPIIYAFLSLLFILFFVVGLVWFLITYPIERVYGIIKKLFFTRVNKISNSN